MPRQDTAIHPWLATRAGDEGASVYPAMARSSVSKTAQALSDEARARDLPYEYRQVLLQRECWGWGVHR